ncbi:replication-relaxation family protein [Streptomyces sp. NPDC044984]|uniref:replication-relaxation family protein n=1 Tax=Streptomyces sp. NPDC044984 TaxID=3154335 RepID=UPI0033CB8343
MLTLAVKWPVRGCSDRPLRLQQLVATQYGTQIASEWPELRGRRPPGGAVDRTAVDRTAVRLKVGHGLTVTETALAFLQDARRRGDVCRPLDWIPEVHHALGWGEAVIPDALLYYRHITDTDGGGSMLRAFVEVDRDTMAPSASPPNSAPTPASTSTYPRPRPAPPGRAGGEPVAALPAFPRSWPSGPRPWARPQQTNTMRRHRADQGCRRTEKSAQACTDERAQSWDREDNPAAVGVSASVHGSTPVWTWSTRA